MRRIATLALCLLTLWLASGCTVYKAAVDERKLGDFVADKAIATEITAEFLRDDTVKVLDMGAASYEGHVYVYGEYEKPEQADRAVAIAKAVKGVRSVTPYFLPAKKADNCGAMDNLSIEAAVDKQLIGDKSIWSTNVDVKVIQCRVLLLGIVGSQAEIDKSIAHAKGVEGVRGVTSFLKAKK